MLTKAKTRLTEAWRVLALGGVVVFTPSDAAPLLKTIIQLDGDVATLVSAEALASGADQERLRAAAALHMTRIAHRIDPLMDLQKLARALWWIAGAISASIEGAAAWQLRNSWGI